MMPAYADLIITNAKVYTVDEENPRAEAVAVRGNNIVYVGDNPGVEAWRGDKTQVIDGNGRTLLPGLIDSHFHLMGGALGMGDVQLYDIKSLPELETAVKAHATANPKTAWLRGQGLRYDVPSTEPLTRHHLDAIEQERPLIIMAFDFHTVWANTAALKAANLLNGYAKLPGGAEIIMGADGLASGELREEAAYRLLLQHIPEESSERRRELMQKGLAYLASLGVTSVHNMDGDAEQAAFYAALEDLGELTLRVYIPYSIIPETPVAAIATEAVPMRAQFQSDMVRAGAVKFFMDGVYESYTAVSLNAYPDQPDNYGDPIYKPGHFARMVNECDRFGLQIFVHACGDGAVQRVLNGFEGAQKANGRRDSRHRVEHIEMIAWEDVPRFAELGVIASMQPLHAPIQENDPDVWPTRIAETDQPRAFAWRTLREAGAILAFGSDWPVAPPDPIWGIAALLNRKGFRPGLDNHTQTLAEAVAGYTRDAAYAEFQEDKKGQIKTGLWADMVLLSDDIFNIPTEKMMDVRVEKTIVNGRIVYEAR